MANDGVGRAGSVPMMGGFAGRHAEQSPQRQRDAAPPTPDGRPARDEVCVRSDAVVALKLLRERVLACTRQQLGIGQVSVPTFAKAVEIESIEAFLSRLISDQNQLAACAMLARNTAPRGSIQSAFEAGLSETRELLANASGDGRNAVELVAAEFARRIAELDS